MIQIPNFFKITTVLFYLLIPPLSLKANETDNEILLKKVQINLQTTIEISDDNIGIVAEVINDYSTFAVSVNPEINKKEFIDKITEEIRVNGVVSGLLSKLLIDLDNSFRIEKPGYAFILNTLINKLNPDISQLFKERLNLPRQLEEIKIGNRDDNPREIKKFGSLFNSKLNDVLNNEKEIKINREKVDLLNGLMNKNDTREDGKGRSAMDLLEPQNRGRGPLSGLRRDEEVMSSSSGNSQRYDKMIGCSIGCNGAIATHLISSVLVPPTAPIRVFLAGATCFATCGEIVSDIGKQSYEYIKSKLNNNQPNDGSSTPKTEEVTPTDSPAPAPVPAPSSEPSIKKPDDEKDKDDDDKDDDDKDDKDDEDDNEKDKDKKDTTNGCYADPSKVDNKDFEPDPKAPHLTKNEMVTTTIHGYDFGNSNVSLENIFERNRNGVMDPMNPNHYNHETIEFSVFYDLELKRNSLILFKEKEIF